MTDVALGLRFTADQRELQAASDKGVENVKRIGDAAKKSNEEAARAAQQYTESLKRQADTLGMTRSQVMAYEAAQHKMTDAQRQSAAASISEIDAYEKKTAMLGRVRVAAVAAGAAIGAALVGGLKASIAAAAEAEQSQLRLEAVLKATRGASGMTATELDRMANQMQDRFGISDEAVKDSMAVLLTFRQVGRESFGEAMEVAANLSAVMGTDLKSATLQLGKALEDPEQGLIALTRSGVSFSDGQKSMIKDMVDTGRQAEAITEILKIMKSQGLDGVAEAMNNGLPGAIKKTGIAWDELLETIGKTRAVGGTAEGAFKNIASELREIKEVIESGDWVDILDSLVTPKGTQSVRRQNRAATLAANAVSNMTGAERSAAAHSTENARVRKAQEDARDFLGRFRTDNEKLEDELKKWNARAAAANYTTEQRAVGEARIRAALAKKGSSGANEAAGLLTQLRNELATVTGEGNEYDAFVRKLTDGTIKLTDAQLAEALAIKGQVVEIKRAKEAREAHLRVAEFDAQVTDEIAQLKIRESDAQAKANLAAEDAIERVKLETELIGLSNAERERRIALLELEKNKRHLTPEQLARYRDELSAAYGRKAAAEAGEKLKEDFKRQTDEVERLLSDSLMRGFENGGKSGAQAVKDSLVAAFKTLVLRPLIQPVVQVGAGLTTAALGALGIPGYANAGGGSSLGGAGNLLSQGASLFGGSLFGSAGAYSTALGLSSSAAGSQAALLAAQTGEFGLAGLAGTASSAGAGAMSGLMTAAPYIGAALLAYSVLKKDKTPAVLTGVDASGTVSRAGFTDQSWFGNDANQGYRWATHDHGSTALFNAQISALFDQVAGVGQKLGLDTASLDTARVGFSVKGLQGGGPNEIAAQLAANLGQVSDQLATTLMPNLAEFAQANETATQTLVRLVTVQEQLTAAETQAKSQIADVVRNLPGQLGITGLIGARDALSVSEYQAPLSRLGAARSLLDDTYGRAMGGDLGAVNAFPQLLQQALTIGRDVGASGPAFQALFTEGNRQLNELLGKQQSIQTEMLSEIPIAIIESSKDQLAEMRLQTKELSDGLNRIETELRKLREAA